MKNKKLLFACVSLLCGAVFAAHAAVIPEARAAAAVPEKDWTVMVYMNGRNNLTDSAVKDFKEMEAVGSSSRVNVVVELGRSSSATWRGSKRYLVSRSSDPKDITSAPIMEFPSVNMGDWQHLADFIAWAKTAYPAKKYFLIIWNHGTGAIGQPYPDVTDKSISYDDEARSFISLVQLGRALSSTGKVDVFASDACLMQMAEVAYELKDYATLIMGSEEVEFGRGYDYTGFLKQLAANPSSSPEDAVRYVADSYAKDYVQFNCGATLSVVRSSSLEDLRRLANEWAALAVESGDPTPFRRLRNKAQRVSDPNYKDFGHYVSLLGQEFPGTPLADKSREITTFLSSKAMLINYHQTEASENMTGLTVYLPLFSIDKDYLESAWAKSSPQWLAFCELMSKF